MNIITKTIKFGKGKEITIETGKLAKQADGSVVVRQGNTMLLATVVSAKEARQHVDFMPLSVDYREKFSAAGRIPGGFRKREGRPSDDEVLVARLVDRALRPLFPKDYHADTFVNVELFSADTEGVMPDSLAGLAASAALAVSDIPFNGPISEVRVARIEGELLINPTVSELEISDINIMIAATIDNILMVEGDMKEISEEEMVEAIKFGHEEIKKHCSVQMEMAEEKGVTEKREYCHEEEGDEELREKLDKAVRTKLYDVAKSALAKHIRSEKFTSIKQEFIDSLEVSEDEEINENLIGNYFYEIEKDVIRKLVLDEGIRLDGRKLDEIRDIWCEVDYLPSAHGSAVFTRGETQSLTSVTLGSPLDVQIIDRPLLQDKERFMLHYNFLPYSTGDARPYRGTGRREIGHGNLAHRAIASMLPEKDENPYTIRIVSDILESNGSSSMATVCAGVLALMDTGVQIKKPVSGIAMGLITDSKGNYAVLSDILGDEDHLGDMDFKVTGTKDGITACQMDIKVDGLSYDILTKALLQAKEGRAHILGEMLKTISEPREEYKPHVPGITSIIIPSDLIGTVIGPGGKMIQEIQKNTGTTITIDEIDGHGNVVIMGPTQDSISEAKDYIKGLTAVPEVGQVYQGKVKTIVAFGAFIEILPGKDGLLHISEISHQRTNKVEDVLKEGQEIEVKLVGVDPRTKKLKLSRKALLPKPERKENKESGQNKEVDGNK
ncbi:MAG: polyribonucleotide nucleotidyltransferase [Bacteroidales bacterium]|nr:polyribonucleotide nucleotidyltransferase [Bacteroidales bacterium]